MGLLSTYPEHVSVWSTHRTLQIFTMSRPNKQKISTDAAPGAWLFQAFAGLNLEGLPPGTATPETPLPKDPAPPAKLGRVVLRRETAHRGGKCVVVLDDFSPALDEAFLEALARRLRATCGCGGALKGRLIELQGDQVPRIRQFLENEGFRVAGVS